MPTFVAGLPLHPLVVHAVVVLVPLAVLATVTVAVWPAARRRYGWLAAGVTAVATLAIPIATSSGEELRDRLAPTPLIDQHAELGDQLLVFMVPLLVAVTGLMVVDHYRTRTGRADGPGAMAATRDTEVRWAGPATLTLAVLAVALAVVSAVQVVRIGESGARAAWSGVQYVAPQHHRGGRG